MAIHTTGVEAMVEGIMNCCVLADEVPLDGWAIKVLMAGRAFVFEIGPPIPEREKFTTDWRRVEYIAINAPRLKIFWDHGRIEAASARNRHNRYKRAVPRCEPDPSIPR